MWSNFVVVLFQEIDILILDELINFFDFFGIIWFQKYLEGLEDIYFIFFILILVFYDCDFIFMVCIDLMIFKDRGFVYFYGDLLIYEVVQIECKFYFIKMKDV